MNEEQSIKKFMDSGRSIDTVEDQFLKNLRVPDRNVDVILDTDTYNEIDDQYALSYMLKSSKLNVKGICAAPFFNSRSTGPNDGMEKSYNEILKILDLADFSDMKEKVHLGSGMFLENETTPVRSDAADFIAGLADKYSPDNPLYIVAIGAITNVASAILINPSIAKNCVIIWLGGHAHHIPNPVNETNMIQDVSAARVIFGCGVPLIQLPCMGVVDRFYTTKYELLHWLSGKNPLCDYLCENTIEYMEAAGDKNSPWGKVIWDVTAVAWLLNDDGRFMTSRLVNTPMPEYDKTYSFRENSRKMVYVDYIYREPIFKDLFEKLISEKPL